MNVAIRTVEFDAAGRAVLGVGGGITADSDPDAEWRECLHKAAPVVGRLLPGPQDRVVQLTP
jgi:para-aminobenzoate synthetase component 1